MKPRGSQVWVNVLSQSAEKIEAKPAVYRAVSPDLIDEIYNQN